MGAVEMFIKPCSFKSGSGGSAEERRRRVSDLRAEFGRQASEDLTKSRRRKASELREAFARRAETKEGIQGKHRSSEKSQEGSNSAKSSSPTSLYTVLGVDDEASHKEIRKAFLEKVRECHPDRHTEAESGL